MRSVDPPKTYAGESAQTYILVGLVLQGLEVLAVFGLGLFSSFLPIAGAIVIGLGVLGVIWIILVYIFSYVNTVEGEYGQARTPTLVFGILSLLSGGIISGILFLVAYSKLGDAIEEQARLRPGGYPGGVPPGAKFCPACGQANQPVSRFCHACGSKLS